MSDGSVREEQPTADQTFAEVLNGVTLGGGRRHKRGKSTVDHEGNANKAASDGVEIDRPSYVESTRDFMPMPNIEFSADAAIARPYAWTQGRTKSTVDLRIETMVSTSERGEDVDVLTTEHRSIAELCREPRSVAEVATLLNVPLGVAKVLLGDMAKLDLVIVHMTAMGGANKAHLMLMEGF